MPKPSMLMSNRAVNQAVNLFAYRFTPGQLTLHLADQLDINRELEQENDDTFTADFEGEVGTDEETPIEDRDALIAAVQKRGCKTGDWIYTNEELQKLSITELREICNALCDHQTVLHDAEKRFPKVCQTSN
jgi:hypothetical protein